MVKPESHLYLPGRWHLTNCGDFPRNLRDRMLRQSRIARATGTPSCMYPRCDAREPPEVLQLHHIRAKEYGGGSTEENAILFCARHHGWAHCLLFPPEFCYAFKHARLPEGFDEVRCLSLEALWDRLSDLSEFSDKVPHINTPSRMREIAFVRLAAAYHSDADKADGTWARIMAWTASEQAALLTALTPGRLPFSPRKRHPRNIITSLYQESRRYEAIANDDMLQARNLHIEAVNLNALLLFDTAEARIRPCLELTHRAHHFFMPIRKHEYLAYLCRQQAAIMAKAGDDRALDVASRAVHLAAEIGSSDLLEAKTRQLEAAVLLGRLPIAEEAAGSLASAKDDPNPIRNIIRLKALCTHCLCREEYPEAERYATLAQESASAFGLTHQAHKLRAILRAIDDYKRLRSNWAIKRSDRDGRRPSLLLAALV